MLADALSSGGRVRIIYESESGLSERVIRPIRLRESDVFAYCYLKKANRTFRISGILSASAEKGTKNYGKR